MKKIICLILTFLLVFSFVACGDGSKKELTNVKVKEGYTRYDITDKIEYLTDGFGCQIDTDVYMPFNKLTEDEEKMLEQRIADMNLQYTRIKFFPEYFEEGNDNDDPNTFDYNSANVNFESEQMKALYKILDICEKYGIRVDLSWYGASGGSWLGCDASLGWATAPRKTDTFDGYAEYAENIAVCLDYLVNTKKYTCVWGFSVISEMFINDEAAIVWDDYRECTKAIVQKNKDIGIYGKVNFIGTSNMGYKASWFEEEQTSMVDIYDIFGIGNYYWDNNSLFEGVDYYFEDMMAVARKLGKGMVMSEFCQGLHFTGAVTKSDIDDYSAGMYLIRFIIAATQNGISAFNHYILGDTFFTNAYIHEMGLWMYRNNNWKAHPEYYFYGMLCKYTDIGSEIYPVEIDLVESDDIMMIAYKLPDGSWTYLIVNNGKTSHKAAIVNGRKDRPDSLSAYKLTESAIPEDRACVLPEAYDSINTTKGVAYINLPANSFVVLSNKTFEN